MVRCLCLTPLVVVLLYLVRTVDPAAVSDETTKDGGTGIDVVGYAI